MGIIVVARQSSALITGRRDTWGHTAPPTPQGNSSGRSTEGDLGAAGDMESAGQAGDDLERAGVLERRGQEGGAAERMQLGGAG